MTTQRTSAAQDPLGSKASGGSSVGDDAERQVGPFALDSEELDWQSQANCLGVEPDLFFPERGASTAEAKAVCAGCVVRDQCLEYALAHREKFGIWGGTSERERRIIRRERAQIARRQAG